MDVGPGMGRDTPDLTALEVAILAEAPLSEMALAMLAPAPLTALAPPAWLADWVACIARRWAVPAETAAAWLVAEGAAHLTAAEIVGADDLSGDDRMVLPRPGGPADAPHEKQALAAATATLEGLDALKAFGVDCQP